MSGQAWWPRLPAADGVLPFPFRSQNSDNLLPSLRSANGARPGPSGIPSAGQPTPVENRSAVGHEDGSLITGDRIRIDGVAVAGEGARPTAVVALSNASRSRFCRVPGGSADVVSVTRADVAGGVGGGPAGKQFQSVGRRCIRVRSGEVEAQPGLGGEFHSLDIEVELADGGMGEPFAAAAVEFDVVRGPPMAACPTMRAHSVRWGLRRAVRGRALSLAVSCRSRRRRSDRFVSRERSQGGWRRGCAASCPR
jgi:hypothetical protein